MAPTRKRKPTRGSKSTARRKARAKPPTKKRSGARASAEAFPAALAALLRSRKLPVPRGLAAVPPDAYAREPASVVEELAELGDDELRTYAERIASYPKRQADRAASEWERSPLIAELRRRGLAEPPRPVRPIGASVSLAKPLGEWTDAELAAAAREWSKRAGG